MRIMVTYTMRRIFQNWFMCGHASSGYMAYIVVSRTQTRKINRSIVSRVHGTFFGSRDMSSPTSVTRATIMANGMSYANDHVNRCGFMNPIPVQTTIPICDGQRMNGSEAK